MFALIRSKRIWVRKTLYLNVPTAVRFTEPNITDKDKKVQCMEYFGSRKGFIGTGRYSGNDKYSCHIWKTVQKNLQQCEGGSRLPFNNTSISIFQNIVFVCSTGRTPNSMEEATEVKLEHAWETGNMIVVIKMKCAP